MQSGRVLYMCRNCLALNRKLFLNTAASETSDTKQSNKRFSTTASVKASVKTYYEVLGIKSDASKDDIKQAFVNLSKQLHPDTNQGGSGNHDKFVELNQAYTVLSRAESRFEYDQRRNMSHYNPSQSPSSFYQMDPEALRRHYGFPEQTRNQKGEDNTDQFLKLMLWFWVVAAVFHMGILSFFRRRSKRNGKVDYESRRNAIILNQASLTGGVHEERMRDYFEMMEKSEEKIKVAELEYFKAKEEREKKEAVKELRLSKKQR